LEGRYACSQKSQGINNGHSRSGIHTLPTFDGDAVNIVVETPKGGRAKMKYDEAADMPKVQARTEVSLNYATK